MKPKTYPCGEVWSTHGGRWWYRIMGRAGWIEEAGPHTFDTAAEAADTCRRRMAYLADPLGHTLRAQLEIIARAHAPVFDVIRKARETTRSDYVLAGPAEGVE